MFSRVQPSIKGNPRKRQKISHSPESEEDDQATTAAMATPSSVPTAAATSRNNDLSACHHEQTLKRLEPDLEAMRQLITCKVCQRFLSEPYSLTCGHTYCYECLDAWLVDQKKRTCPGCRAVINQQPTPSYVIREMTLIFTSRAELLPDGETLEEHEEFTREAAEKVARDRDNKDTRHGGLFKGTFRGKDGARMMPIRDPGDNVDRCPQCNWELEHGVCSSCGLNLGDEDGAFSDSDGSSLSEGDSELDHELMREIEADEDHRAIGGLLGGDSDFSDEDEDLINEEINARLGDGAQDVNHIFATFPAGAAGRPIFWGPEDDSDGDDSDADSEEMALMDGFINDEAEEDHSGSGSDEQDEEEVQRAPRRLHRRAQPLADSSDEEEGSGPRVIEVESDGDEEEDEEEGGPVAPGSQRTKTSRSTRRHQSAAFSSEEDESDSDSNSEDESESDSESDSGSESDSSDSSSTVRGIEDIYTAEGAAETGAFSPLQEDGDSESGYDLHGHDDEVEDRDDEQDEDEDDDNDYGGADLGVYGAYNDDPEEATRAETPEDDRPAQLSASHRLLKRQRRRARHMERTVAHRSRTPTRNARGTTSGPDHPFQLGNTLVRINERQQRLGNR